jgi:hypothetical protein
VFGLATFGTIYGTIICISGLFTFSQSALQALVHDAFHDDPTPANLALSILGLVSGGALVGYVAVAGKRVKQEVVEEEERRSLLPTPRQTPQLGPWRSPSLTPYGTMRDARGPGGGRLAGLERPSLANLRSLSTVHEGGGGANGGGATGIAEEEFQNEQNSSEDLSVLRR